MSASVSVGESVKVRLKQPAAVGKFFIGLSKFMRSLNTVDSAGAFGVTKSVYKTSNNSQRPPLHLILHRAKVGGEKCRLSFAYLHIESSLHVTFGKNIVSIPEGEEPCENSSASSTSFVCIDHESISHLIAVYMGRKDKIHSADFCIGNTSMTTTFLGKSKCEMCNISHQLSTSIGNDVYKRSFDNGMLPEHLYGDHKSEIDSTAPEWVARLDFSQNKKFTKRRNQRVVYFGVEIKIPHSSGCATSTENRSVFTIMAFVFDPDKVKDGSMLDFCTFAERVDVKEASKSSVYHLKVIHDDETLPQSLKSALESIQTSGDNSSGDSKNKVLMAMSTGLLAKDTQESQTPPKSPRDTRAAQSHKDAPTSMPQFIERFLKGRKIQPRAALAFMGLVPKNVVTYDSYSGPVTVTFTKRGGSRVSKEASNDGLSCIFESRRSQGGVTVVQRCTSSFQVDKDLSPVTLAESICHRVTDKAYAEKTRYRVVRAIEKFIKSGGKFGTALQKATKKRKARQGPAAAIAEKRQRTQDE